MFLLIFLLLTIFGLNLTSSSSENNSKFLPKLYEISDYNECLKLRNIYCLIDLNLRPIDDKKESTSWKLIQETLNNPSCFNYSKIRRTVCVNKGEQVYEIEEKHKIYNKNFSKYGLTSSIQNIYCLNENIQFNALDYSFVLFSIIWVISVIYATTKDKIAQKNNTDQMKTPKQNSWINIFSIFKNWNKLKNQNKKFEFIEGLRTYTMISIIFFHNVVSYVSTYLDNPDFVEKLFENKILLTLFNSSMFTIQIFIVISAFFLSKHILDIYEKNKQFNLKDAYLIITNRYLRLFLPLFVIVCLHMLNFNQLMSHGVQKQLVQNEISVCYKKWYLTLFLVHNWFGKTGMCAAITWYAAVDFQLYVFSTIIFYLLLKLKLKIYRTIIFLVTASLILNILWNYIHQYPVVYPVSPKSYRMAEHVTTPAFLSLYLSTYSNCTSYFIGLLFGILHKKLENKNIVFSKTYLTLWFVGSLGLPTLSTILIMYNYSPLVASILGAVVKPVYALGNSIMILGMTLNTNLPFYSVFAWKPVVFLGNFSYSIYIFHFLPLLGKLSNISSPIHLTMTVWIASIIWDILSSYVVGILAYLFIEAPAINLQKKLVPGVKTTIVIKNGKAL